MATTLNGTSLGKVQSWRNSKNGNMLPIPIPAGDSESTDVVDMLGVTEFIDIQGQMTGAFDTVQTAVKDIKSLIDGDQSSSVTLSSEYVITNSTAGSVAVPGTLSVKVESFDYTWDLPGLNMVTYQLKLIVGN